MKIKKFFNCFLIFAVIISLLAAATSCQNQDDQKNKETISFTDALGRAVEVEKSPEKVAALLGSFADVWVLSGGELCAAAEDAWEDFGLSLNGAVNIGGAHSPSKRKQPTARYGTATVAQKCEQPCALTDYREANAPLTNRLNCGKI